MFAPSLPDATVSLRHCLQRSSLRNCEITLALSDLLSAIFVMPFVCGVLVASKWVFGDVVAIFTLSLACL